MVRRMTDMPAGTIGFEAVGEVEDDDWEDTVEPVLRQEIAAGRKVRLLYLLGPGDARGGGRCREGRHRRSARGTRPRSIASPWSATRTGCARRCARCRSCCRARRRASRSGTSRRRRRGWPPSLTEAEAMGDGDADVARGRAQRGDGQPPAGRPAGDGDVRARRRHVADERVDLGGRRGPRHDGQRRAGGDRARGARLGRVHPDRQQGRRPHRAQARVRARAARLRDRRPGDDARAGPHGDHRLLGDHRRARRVAAAAGDAVADPRQLRGRGAEEGLRAGRRGGGDRRRRRAAARRLPHHLPVVARRVRAARSS